MFKKILVPIDPHRFDDTTVDLAFRVGRDAKAQVIMLHVVDDSFPNPDILSFQLPWADYYAHLRDEAQTRLTELVARLGGGIDAEVVVISGKPADKIVAFANEEQCDLVIMATHATRGLHHALLGSVTDKVIRLVHCPVMVTRMERHERHE